MTLALPNQPVLSVRDLQVAYGATQAVRGLSFDVHAGETLALVGESGSGKSTTAMAIPRLIERDGGRITGGSIRFGRTDAIEITGLPQGALRALRGERIGMVFQEPMTSLNPVMTVGAQVREALEPSGRLRGGALARAAEDALDRVTVPDARRRLGQYPHELSGGLRQRVMIAMALARAPELLIADEPTTALDVTTQAEILALLRVLQGQLGMAVLFITHDLGVVSEIADRTVVLRHGTKVEEGLTAAILRRPRAPYTRELMAATPRLGDGSPAPLGTEASVLRLRGVTVTYRGTGTFRRGPPVAAVRGVSLDIHEGETLGLVGESGCGKSTLARAVMRLVDPSAGTVELLGHRIDHLSARALRPHRAGVQMVFQDPYASLNPRLPVRDLVTEPAHLRAAMTSNERRTLATTLLAKVDLPVEAVDRYPHQFSGGQRQRICIARALSTQPRLIVADEAVSALDVSNARRVTSLIADIQRRDGVSFLFISHDIAVVERVSHRIAVMLRGEIVETGPTAEVLARPRHDYTKRLLDAVPRVPAWLDRTRNMEKRETSRSTTVFG